MYLLKKTIVTQSTVQILQEKGFLLWNTAIRLWEYVFKYTRTWTYFL